MPTSCFGGLRSCWILGRLWRSCEQQTLATKSLVVVVIHTFCVQKHLCPHIFVSTHFVSGHTLAKCISLCNIVPTHIRHPFGSPSEHIWMRVYLAKRGFHQMVLNFQAHTDSTPAWKMFSRSWNFFGQTNPVCPCVFTFTTRFLRPWAIV